MNLVEFRALLTERLQILNRPVYVREMSDGVWVNFYNVPSSVSDGADRENNRQGIQVSGFKPGAVKVKVTQVVSGPAFSGSAYKLRAKTTTPEQAVKYIVDFLVKCATQEPSLWSTRRG